jgi:serine O-acetyltransferase
MFPDIRQDLRRCGRTVPERVREVVYNPPVWAVFGYRFRRWAASLPRPLRWPLAVLTIPAHVGVELLTHIQLSVRAEIGPGLYLPHSGTIVVGTGSVVGRNCTIAHNVTIGHAGGRTRSASGSPVIGDRVYIGPGAIIIGPITVGNDALIGAGAVVVKSVPPRGVVVGNPAKLLGRSGSFDLIEYPGSDTDPGRAESLAESEAFRANPIDNKVGSAVNGSVA